jgi:gamma-glutamylcyclotransferase (GGCT)/AIG2-like uncharacterized protein YtfP
MNAHLFVYGTLLSRARHPMGARLRREARLLGAATMPGRLYSLGRYPGMVEATDADCLVHGELYSLNDPAASLEWLDAYEGVVPGSQDQNQYERAERPVRLATGEEIKGWVYLYRKRPKGPPIASGRWVVPDS